MPLLPTHKILPDININGHPANVISITTVTGLSSNTVQSAIEEININVIENSNTITLTSNQANSVSILASEAYNRANTAYNIAVLNLMGY